MSDMMINAHLDATPNPNFLKSLRESGYSNYTSIADLIDNSIDTNVNSTHVEVTINHSKGEYKSLQICDNGCGMSQDTLKEAFKLGALTGKNREHDLGSYGTGMKAASLSWGRCFEVRTKTADGDLLIATYDLDAMIEKSSFDIPFRVGTSEECDEFKKQVNSDTGSIITVTKIDRANNSNVSIFKRELIKKLSLFFGKFIDNGVEITVNGKNVPAFDPMHRNESFSEALTVDENFEYKNNVFQFGVYYIERLDKTRTELIGRNNANAGLYIYRNNRLVGSGLDLGIIGKHGDGWLNGLRIELYISGNCDELFGSTFNKLINERDKTELDGEFLAVCKEAFNGYIRTIRLKERDGKSNDRVSDDVQKDMDDIYKNINGNKHIKVDKKGKNTPNPNSTPRTPTKNPGRNKPHTRKRNDVFAEWRLMSRGELGIFFNTVKENGKYIIEYNSDHPFWADFMVDATNESKNIISQILVSMGISLEKVTYFDDAEKEELFNEYFIQMSEYLRKFIKY